MQNLLKRSSNIFDIVTILNQRTQGDNLFYCSKLQDVLMQCIALEEIENDRLFSDFMQKIPLIQTSFTEKDFYFLKISLLSKKIGNPAKFFYEMIDRWLLPGKKPIFVLF